VIWKIQRDNERLVAPCQQFQTPCVLRGEVKTKGGGRRLCTQDVSQQDPPRLAKGRPVYHAIFIKYYCSPLLEKKPHDKGNANTYDNGSKPLRK